MIQINKTQNNTYEITKGDCHPPNRIGNFDKRDLEKLMKKIEKICKIKNK